MYAETKKSNEEDKVHPQLQRGEIWTHVYGRDGVKV